MSRDWEKLKKEYAEKGLVLFLGAGVSHDSGLPDWEELLRRLEEKVRKEGEPSIIDTLKQNAYSLPAIVSVLEASYPERREDFARAIQEQLYRDFAFRSRLKTEADQSRFVSHEQLRRNATLRAAAGFCAVRKRGGGYAPNPLVRAVVTTNVDSLLRSYAGARFRGGEILRSIDRASAGRVADRIPVYYMHGFIRFDRDVSEVRKHAADLRVFTEQEFFDFFDNPNGLYNYTLLYLLREYPCLFIGLSLKDDNIRRLLHYSKRERAASYASEGVTGDEAERKCNRHYLIAKYPEAEGGRRDARLADLTRRSLRHLGVNVLWVNSYPEISERLGEIYKSERGARSWSYVFDE